MSNLRRSSAPRALAWCAVTLAAAARPGPVRAQAAVSAATVGGRVTDPSGAVVPGVHVTARSAERGQSFATDTDDGGRYRLLYLPVDRYSLTFERPPFAPVTRSLSLS